MAAILCGGIGKCFSGLCSCTGDVCVAICTAPCKLCSCIGKGCAEVCNSTKEWDCPNCCSFLSNPFCFHVTVTLLLNIPCIAILFSEISNSMKCEDGLGGGGMGLVWLGVGSVFCLFNILAAWYMAMRITNTSPTTSQDDPLQTRTTAFSRASYLLCNDPKIAVYILIVIGYFVWLCLGISWRIQGSFASTTSSTTTCQDTTGTNVGTAIGFGFGFFVAGGCTLMIGFCCAYFDKTDYSTPYVPPQTTTNNNDVENPPQHQQYPLPEQPQIIKQQQQVDDNNDDPPIAMAYAEPIPGDLPPPIPPPPSQTTNTTASVPSTSSPKKGNALFTKLFSNTPSANKPKKDNNNDFHNVVVE